MKTETIKVDNVTVTIIRPELTAEEQAQREKEIMQALKIYCAAANEVKAI